VGHALFFVAGDGGKGFDMVTTFDAVRKIREIIGRALFPGSGEYALGVAALPNVGTPVKIWSSISAVQGDPAGVHIAVSTDTTATGAIAVAGYNYLRIMVNWSAGAKTATLGIWDKSLLSDTVYGARAYESGQARQFSVSGNMSFVDIPTGGSTEMYISVPAISGTCDITAVAYN
jgi:hypothetical protein